MSSQTLHALVVPDESLLSVIKKITAAPSRGGASGIAVIVDKSKKVLGVLTDGDIRKAIARGEVLSKPVSQFMNTKPLCLPADQSHQDTLREAFEAMRARDQTIEKIVLVDHSGRFVDIVNVQRLYRAGDVTQRRIAVYGLGFVGLTLALTLAEDRLFRVVGVDVDATAIAKLKRGEPTFFENGLESLLNQTLSQGSISFAGDGAELRADVYVIAVGTPVDAKQKPVLKHLRDVGGSVGRLLKKGDLVICRSTVPPGTTREFLIPILQKESGLEAGADFHVAFAPERTVAGRALKELKTLPQIIGGFTPQCARLASAVFEKITNAIIQVQNLEAAEIVKLVNNTYRDLVFSFANEVSFLCDRYNIDAFELIGAANDGYPRNPIPAPSPGVGGICLSKDPYLYASGAGSKAFSDVGLGRASRAVNSRGVDYAVWQFDKFVKHHGLKKRGLPVMIVGIAFKGIPETSDTRHSVALELASALAKSGCNVSAFDAVLSGDALKQLGLKPVKLASGITAARAVFFMNNHPDNVKFDVYRTTIASVKPALFFDGFASLNKKEIENIPGLDYATLGYIRFSR